MKRKSIAFSALGILCLTVAAWFSTEGLATGVWTQKEPIPTARYGSSVGTIDGKIYVASGCCATHDYPYTRFTNVDVYDPTADSWTPLAPISLGVYGSGYGVLDGKLYVAGGESSPAEGQVTARLQVYDPVTNSWSDKAPLPSAQRSLGGTVMNGKLYVAGRFSGALLVYDPVADSWSSLAAPAVTRWAPVMTAVNGKLYLIGGHDDSGTMISAVEEFDPVTNTWSFKAPLPLPRTGSAVAELGGLIYVISGGLPFDGVGYPSPTNVDIYDPATDTWSAGPPLNIGRTHTRAAVANNTIFVISGFNWPDISIFPPNQVASIEALTSNTTPSINGASVTVTQNSPSNVQIASVDDAEDGPSGPTVSVTSSNPSNGVTVSNIVNTGGVITANISASTVGPASFTLTVTDSAGATATSTLNVTVVYNFGGFVQPVDNLPLLNVANAGSSIPVKFSLSGNQGLGILAAGYPASSPVACDANEPGSVIEETVTAGASTLSYNAIADQYSYVWKTNKAWKGTCRMLVVRFIDGTDHLAKFRFK